VKVTSEKKGILDESHGVKGKRLGLKEALNGNQEEKLLCRLGAAEGTIEVKRLK